VDLGLRAKVGLVTGGSLGIGRATAVGLAREGAHVAVCARGKEALDAAADAIRAAGGKALVVQADCTRPEEAARLMRTVVTEFGRIDILVNSLGAAKGGNFLDLTERDWQESLALKLLGQIRCCREALPIMRAQGGGRYRYYVCRGRLGAVASSREEPCSARFIPAGQLEEVVWADLSTVLQQPELVTAALERAHSGAPQPGQPG